MSIIKYLSRALLSSESTIESFVRRAPHRYKIYSIPKRKGGERIIAQPAKELKYIQKLVLDKYLSDLPIHESVFSYRAGLNIKSNASMHVKNKYLLKMDFHDFFNSINHVNLITHYENYNEELSEGDKFTLRNIFFYKQKTTNKYILSVGAPSSPFISNTILYEFDKILFDYSRNHDVVYTRYADDLTLTTNSKGVLFDFPNKVKIVCDKLTYPTLKINPNKTVFSSKKYNRHVTGLVLTNDFKVSLGRKKKRYIRSLVHKFVQNKLSLEEINSLKGYIAFASGVEPEFIKGLCNKYSEKVISDIKCFQGSN